MATLLNDASKQISTVSPDGYVRMAFSSLTAIRFEHRLAWLDDELLQELLEENVPALKAGYCEWNTAQAQQISLGWAWFTVCANGAACLAPGGISSNVMFVDAKCRDMGAQQTDALLRGWLASLQWQPLDIAPSFCAVQREPVLSANCDA